MGFTFRHLKPTDPYFACWLERKRRTRQFWLAFLAWPFATVALSVIWQSLLKDSSFFWVLLVTVPPLVFFRLRQVRWPCPRCGNPFYASGFLYRAFANSCLHCGLLEYAADDTEVA